MSDDLANRLKATLMLVQCARDWERLANDESLDPDVRTKAALNAWAIRGELRPT